jgi:hypothetical protein
MARNHYSFGEKFSIQNGSGLSASAVRIFPRKPAYSTARQIQQRQCGCAFLAGHFRPYKCYGEYLQVFTGRRRDVDDHWTGRPDRAWSRERPSACQRHEDHRADGVHRRVADLHSSPHDQPTEQLRLAIEAVKERQESELINSPEYGLLASAADEQRVRPLNGAPTPDDLDELITRVWKEPCRHRAGQGKRAVIRAGRVPA